MRKFYLFLYGFIFTVLTIAVFFIGCGSSGSGGSSSGGSGCHCPSAYYYCQGSWGDGCCSQSLGEPYLASDNRCYSSLFNIPSNLRYVQCGGC
ncbi:MAG: hypothetical protein ABSE95_02120 [Thermodesulfobacteriota bacterium]